MNMEKHTGRSGSTCEGEKGQREVRVFLQRFRKDKGKSGSICVGEEGNR